MNQKSDFETLGEQSFFGELEDENSRRRRSARGRLSPAYAAAMRKARALRQQRQTGKQFRKWPFPPRPRPKTKFPSRFPLGGPPFSVGSQMGSNQEPEPCPPCNCPSCGDQPNATQPIMDQPAGAEPFADNAAATSASGDQLDTSQALAGNELSEFNYKNGRSKRNRSRFFRWDKFGFDTNELEVAVDRKSASYIKWVQGSLNSILGLKLATDGAMGPQTRSAIRSFQQKNGLVVDGLLGSQTEAALIRAGAIPPTDSSGTIRAPQTQVPLYRDDPGKILSTSTQCETPALKSIPLLGPSIVSCLTVEVPIDKVRWLLNHSLQEKGTNWVKQLNLDITKRLQKVQVTIELFRVIPVRPDDLRVVAEMRKYMAAKGIPYYSSALAELNLRETIQTNLGVSLEALYRQAGVLGVLPADEYRRYFVFVYATFPDSVKQYLRPVGNYVLDRFEFDKSALRDFHLPIVRSMARDVVDSWETSQRVIGIHLRGHTDERGTLDYNYELGSRRADTVKQELKIEIAKIVPAALLPKLDVIKVAVGSLGKDEPVSKTDSSLNRRVEVIFDYVQSNQRLPLDPVIQ